MTTRRATVPALEEILEEEFPVLDHGFVRVIDYMGDDEAIAQSARVSYGRGTRKLSDNERLIRYLMSHRHNTPFEMCEIKFHVKLPIFVARQWLRHRTANVNEYSARYSIMDKEFYIPDKKILSDLLVSRKINRDREIGQNFLFEQPDISPQFLGSQSSTNRQGRERLLDDDEVEFALNLIKSESSRSYTNYEKLLNEDAAGRIRDANRKGISRELARLVLTSNIYTQMYWKIDLHNLLHFLSLRDDPHAQHEIQLYAAAIAQIVNIWVPIAASAFREYRRDGMVLSATMLMVLQRILAGEKLTYETSGLTKREWREMAKRLRLTSDDSQAAISAV